MATQKSYLVKFYDQDGATLRRALTTGLPDDPALPHLKSAPTFTTRMNGGQGELVLDLNAPLDDFDEGTLVDFMNVVKVYAVTIDEDLVQSSALIYTGFVSRYEPYAEADGSEGVRVTCLGLVSLLTGSYFKDGSDFSVGRGPEDPTDMAKAVIDHFNTVYGGSLIGYDASSIPATVGTSVSYTFTDLRWSEALVKAFELAGEGWWWRIDQDGLFTFKARPGSAAHTFTVGLDVASLNVVKDSEQVVNDAQVRRASGTASDYSDAASQAEFGTGSPATGKRSQIVSDSSITDATTADQRGNKLIADGKDEKVKATLVVNTAYPIESIRVGETCNVRHLRYGSGLLPDNLQIVSVAYQGDSVTLELEEPGSDFGSTIQSFVAEASGSSASGGGGGGGGSGEANTASNVGSAGTGLFDAKVGVDLQFRKVNSLSGELSITLDSGNKKVDFAVQPRYFRHFLHMGG